MIQKDMPADVRLVQYLGYLKTLERGECTGGADKRALRIRRGTRIFIIII